MPAWPTSATRTIIPLRLQALPRNRRLLSSSTSRAAALALRASPVLVAEPETPAPAAVDNQPAHVGRYSRHFKVAWESFLNKPYSEENALLFQEAYATDDLVESGHMLRGKVVGHLAQTAAHLRLPALVKEIISGAMRANVNVIADAYENVMWQLIRNERWVDAYDVSELVLQKPALLTSRLLRFRAQALAELKLYSDLRTTMELHFTHDVSRSRRTYNIYIRASLESQDVEWARSLLAQMEADQIPFDATTFTAILSGYRALGPSKDVEARVYSHLRQLGLLTNHHCLNALVNPRLDANDVPGARRILALFQRHAGSDPDPEDAEAMYQISSALDEHGYLKQSTSSSEAFPPNPTLEVSPHIAVSSPLPVPSLFQLNVVLNRHSRTGNTTGAAQIWDHILEQDITPTPYTVAAVIRTLCHSSKENSVPPPRVDEAITFASLCLYGNGRRSDEFQARLRLPQASSSSYDDGGLSSSFSTIKLVHPVKPSMKIFNALFKGLILPSPASTPTRLQRRVEGLIEEIRHAGLEPDAYTLSIFLSYLEREERARSKDLQAIVHQLTRWPSPSRTLETPAPSSSSDSASSPSFSTSSPASGSGWQPMIIPSVKHLNIVLRAERNSPRPPVKRLRSVPPNGGPATPSSFTSAQNSSPQHHRTFTSPSLDSATLLGEVGEDLTPSYPHDSSPAALRAQTPISQAHESFLQLLEARSGGTPTDPRTWATRILLSPPSASRRIFSEMKDRGLVPDGTHYLALMRSFIADGQVSAAARVLLSAIAAGVLTSLAMFTVMIVAYGKMGQPALAKQTFDQMRRQTHFGSGGNVDLASVDALARAYLMAGDAKRARVVILEHWAEVDRGFEKRSPEFMDNMKTLGARALMKALMGLNAPTAAGGSQGVDVPSGNATKAPAGAPSSQARRIVTRRLVKRVVRKWKEGDGPRKPVSAHHASNVTHLHSRSSPS